MNKTREKMMMKLPKQFEPIFADNNALDEAAGRALAAWAKGGAAPNTASPSGDAKGAAPSSTPGQEQGGAATMSLIDMAREAAQRGRDVFNAFYKGRDADDKATLRGMKAELEALMPVDEATN